MDNFSIQLFAEALVVTFAVSRILNHFLHKLLRSLLSAFLCGLIMAGAVAGAYFTTPFMAERRVYYLGFVVFWFFVDLVRAIRT